MRQSSYSPSSAPRRGSRIVLLALLCGALALAQGLGSVAARCLRPRHRELHYQRPVPHGSTLLPCLAVSPTVDRPVSSLFRGHCPLFV